jgi:hypothetical protein
VSNTVCNQVPIIQTLSNVSIQCVFVLCQMTFECVESRINLAEVNVILLEKLYRLHAWVKSL